MLSVPWENWTERVAADRANPQHFFQGKTYTFDQMVELHKPRKLADLLTPEVFSERHGRCQKAIRELGDIFVESKPDVAVVVGNDQMEIFTSDHVPAFAVFWGPYVEGIPRTPEFLASLPPGVARAELDRTPSVYTQYPTLPGLGSHIIQKVMADDFDVAQLTRLPTGAIGSNAAPHAYGFVYRRLMRDQVIPHVPVFVNTFYPPNQPPAARCYAFGRALARAIASWPEDINVAVIASGGMTHFVLDEAFDAKVLEAMQNGRRGNAYKFARRDVSIGHVGNQELDRAAGHHGGSGINHEADRLRSLLPVGSGDGKRNGVRSMALRLRTICCWR